jgi:two-component system chemotaxis sensor kinase CheA
VSQAQPNAWDAEVQETFLREAADRLTEVEHGLLALEHRRDVPDPELLGTIFRAAHSLKAAANLLEYRQIEGLTHKLENILDDFRTGRLAPDPDNITVLLEAVDKLRELTEDPAGSESSDILAHLAMLESVSGDG